VEVPGLLVLKMWANLYRMLGLLCSCRVDMALMDFEKKSVGYVEIFFAVATTENSLSPKDRTEDD